MSNLPRNFLSEPPHLLQGGPEALKARNLFAAREIANRLFDDKGIIRYQKALLKELEENLYFLSPYHSLDAPMREWMRDALQELCKNEKLRQMINRFYKPVNFPYGDDLIRLTLDIPAKEPLLEIHAKKAAVVCLLTYFRQNVGSCFATAPAIQILAEQRELFLKECQELLATGRMRRVVEGQEYAVPLSPNWGLGHLNRPIAVHDGLEGSWAFVRALEAAGIKEMPPLPKGLHLTWDFLLKKAIATAMGIDDEKLQGIEQQLMARQLVTGDLITGSAQVIDFKDRYEAAKASFLSCTENALLRSWEYTLASFSEAKAQFIGWNLYHSLGVDTDQPDGIGAACFSYLTEKLEELKKEIEEYQALYERLFIEAKTTETRARRGDSEWTQMEYRSKVNEMESVLAKRDDAHDKASRIGGLYPQLIETYNELFPLYFQEIYDAGMQPETKSFLDDSPAGFRLLFKHGRTNPSAWTFVYNADQFIDALAKFFTMTETLLFEKPAFQGLEKELGNLVSHIIIAIRSPRFLEAAQQRVAKIHEKGTPWEYVSGGSLVALLSTVYGANLVKDPKKRVLEAPEELLVFIIETFKDAPPKKSVLATSPTHAFVVRPDFEDFKNTWDNNLYTYTWVRDNLLVPRRNFFELIMLDDHAIRTLLDRFSVSVSLDVSGPLTPFDLMKKASQQLKHPALVSHFEAHLYNSLPLFPAHQLKDKVATILGALGLQEGLSFPERPGELLTAEDLRQSLYQVSRPFKTDPYKTIAWAMEKEGFAPPRALIFADTNWTREYFAFHVGLLSTQLELVLSDYTGSSIRPMREWRQYLDGRVKEPWALYL